MSKKNEEGTRGIVVPSLPILLAFLESVKFLFHVPYILQLERCLPKKPLYLFVYNNYIYKYIFHYTKSKNSQTPRHCVPIKVQAVAFTSN